MCGVEKDPSQEGPPHRGATGLDSQTIRTCLEVSEEPCWGPGEISVLGILPGLEMRLPEEGQDRGRTDVSKAPPEAMQALVSQFSNQSHNSIPTQSVLVPRLDHGKAIPCGLFSLVASSIPTPPPLSPAPPPTSRPKLQGKQFVSTRGCCSLFSSLLNT